MPIRGSHLSDAASAASESISSATEHVGRQADRVRRELDVTERRARELVEQYPIACFLGALALGYIAGRVATRL
jgi:hypothetical protein